MEITRKKWGPASTPSCPVPTIKDYTLQAISWLFFESFSTITLLLRKYLTQPNTILGNCIMGFEKQHARKYAAVDRLHFDTTKWVLTYFGGSKYVAKGTQQEPQNALKEGSSKSKEACSINSQCLKDWNDLSEAAK